eukprot:CAMPEP_0113612512 /NCGR_PEP_ID=MMETSP0017_2-20120614/6139_1 /TAXON_ID=2856 /ORGANISM="Cylindrotheca closterium" /LENGTH=318 /DNA_ID=CAMNT_0000521551 /DNA_START=171 /DNA_END=1127 /DNA_ORIENTATION=- /assembly_acc=CAM_ASM_000147
MLRSATRTSRVVSTALAKSRQPTISICRISKANKSTTTPSAAAVPTKGAAAWTKIRLQNWNTLVQDPKVKEALPYIGNAAYVALASGFLMTDMLSLRVALVGGYAGLVSFHALHPRPLQIPLRWSAVFVLVNAGAAYMLAMDRFGAPLSKEEEELYQNHFSQLTKGQFYQLLTLGKKQEVPDGSILTREGRICPRLYFIEKGTAKVFHHGAFAANVDEGGFVNDVAFQIGEDEGAYGTIVTDGECSIIVWDQAELREHLESRSDMDRNTKYLLSEHLMKSLLKQREARRWNQKIQQRLSHNPQLSQQLQVEEKQIQYP